ncbi:MAG: hypothetical protein ACO3JG_05435 [Luteolibacter sp.]
MNPIRPILLLATLSLAHANEALDILEADKSPEQAPVLPGAAATPENVVYPDYTWPEWQTRTFDPIWARAVLFDDQTNPWVQHVAVTGFFEWRAAFGEADVDGAPNVDLDSTRTRRARLGARIRAFGNTDIEAIGEIAGDANHSGLERLSARTEFLPDAGVSYGKFRPQFTAEYRQEPEFSPYPDRAMLVNMIAPQTTLGIHFDYRRNGWDYGIGWFSSDYDPYVPSLRGDGILALNLGRTIVGMEGDTPTRTRWHLDYLHNFDAGRSNSLPRYNVAGRTSANGGQLVANNPAFRHLVSTGFTLEQERFSFLGDFMIAKGETTAWGLTLSPTWWAVPGWLEVVGRYHYAASDDPGALVATMGASADPFFDSSPFFIGDEYHSFYLGANAHLYQNRIRLMSGLENVILKDEAGAGFNAEAWIWHTGVKASF